MHRHRKFHRTYPQNRHLSTVYESTIEQLQEQVASLKKFSENGSDQLRALREETIQITRRQKREAEDLIRTLQSQVMETLKQFPAQDSTLQHQVREQEGRLMAQATQIKQQSAQLEAQSAQIKQQRTQLEAQSAQIETLQSDLAKKEKDLTSLRKQLVQSGNILQQVQQSLERVQLSAVLPLRPRLSRPWKRQKLTSLRQTLPFRIWKTGWIGCSPIP